MCEEFMTAEASAGRCGQEAQLKFKLYCDLLVQRASGTLMTCAQYFRRFIHLHPDYNHDSIVTPTISHDLTVLSINLGLGVWTSPDLHGKLIATLIPLTPIPTTTILPQLSSMAEPIVDFKEEYTATPGPKSFVLLNRISLNQIEGKYQNLCDT